MADKSALGWIGLMFGAATMIVTTIGAVVVSDHITGRLTLTDNLRVVSLPQEAR